MTGNPSPPTYGLTALTLDYVATGSVPFHTELSFAESDPFLMLAGVEVQYMRKESAPPDSLAWFGLPRGGTTMAFVPTKDIRQMQRYVVWQEYKRSLKAVFYVGPYYIHGTALLLAEGQLPAELPVYDARVTFAPNMRYIDLRVPFLLLNRNWVEGFRAG